MKLLTFAPLLIFITAGANAQELNCRDFQRLLKGSWIPIRQILVLGPVGNVAIGPGNSFDPGIPFKGIDFAALLNAKCDSSPPL
jgi:hypothetical protein